MRTAKNPFYSGRGRTLTVGGRTGGGGRKAKAAQLHDDAVGSTQVDSISISVDAAMEFGLLQFGTGPRYLDTGSYGEYSADDLRI